MNHAQRLRFLKILAENPTLLTAEARAEACAPAAEDAREPVPVFRDSGGTKKLLPCGCGEEKCPAGSDTDGD